MPNNNQYVVPQAQAGLQSFKNQVASQIGVQTGADVPSRLNGKVGGQMVKQMIAQAEQQLGGGATFR
jgi:hypothetical protein